MSSLPVHGRNAARHAKKTSDIRRVKAAIRWHEQQRLARQEMLQKRAERKLAIISSIQHKAQYITKVKKQALQRTREDWKLGDLRPNRAIGKDADIYGALTAGQAQGPEITAHAQEHWNHQKAKKGLAPEYPLVIDDKKYFHIVEGDRVTVTQGREKGKIGTVAGVIDRTHQVLIRGFNMQYYDSTVLARPGEVKSPKTISETPIDLDIVRLVIPFASIDKDGQRVFDDVIVDDVFMEQHTTGIDPFTGDDYGDAEFPKEHRYDPVHGLPIFQRYIAGTRHRIEWPWEKEEAAEETAAAQEDPVKNESWVRKTLGTIRHPITSLRSWGNKEPEGKAVVEKQEEPIPAQLQKIEAEAENKRNKLPPTSSDPELPAAYDETDTTRNIVEGAESMSYTLLAPPFPNSLSQELRSEFREHAATLSKEAREAGLKKRTKARYSTPEAQAQKEAAAARRLAAQRMKTPLQLRWEADRAKKAAEQKAAPLVSNEALMIALGQHMQQSLNIGATSSSVPSPRAQ